jgi:Aldehyde dehydrogenase family
MAKLLGRSEGGRARAPCLRGLPSNVGSGERPMAAPHRGTSRVHCGRTDRARRAGNGSPESASGKRNGTHREPTAHARFRWQAEIPLPRWRQAIRSSLKHIRCVFSLLFDGGTDVGIRLVEHPLVKAVGFTGSRQAGRALLARVAARSEPISSARSSGNGLPAGGAGAVLFSTESAPAASNRYCCPLTGFSAVR